MKTVSSELPAGAKCTRCKGRAVVRLPSHNSRFCPDCYIRFVRTAVGRAMKRFPLPRQASIRVAVSGGKDSLALWDILHDLGYSTRGVHIDLGIEGFSGISRRAVEDFARERNLPWSLHFLKDLTGYSIPEARRLTRRKICSVCGVFKRRLLDRLAVGEGGEVLATGHNLDDEAGRLMGNLIRHRTEYLEKFHPFLPSRHPAMPVKIKPLYRLESVEIRYYCAVKGISPAEEKCPLARGATSHVYKEALQFLEDRMPGAKRDFLFSYLKEKGIPWGGGEALEQCHRCGEPSYGSLCGMCGLLDQLRANREAVEADGS